MYFVFTEELERQGDPFEHTLNDYNYNIELFNTYLNKEYHLLRI